MELQPMCCLPTQSLWRRGTHLGPHAVGNTPQNQRPQPVGAGQAGGDQVPGQVTHCVVMGELQVSLPAQPLLRVLMLGGPVTSEGVLDFHTIYRTENSKMLSYELLHREVALCS